MSCAQIRNQRRAEEEQTTTTEHWVDSLANEGKKIFNKENLDKSIDNFQELLKKGQVS